MAWMVGMLENDELERAWYETAVAYSRYAQQLRKCTKPASH
jgi:hypothetical protein